MHAKAAVEQTRSVAASGDANSAVDGGNDREKLKAWLLSLDGNKGTMSRYLDNLLSEFGDLTQLEAAVLPDQGGSVLQQVDAIVFETLNMTTLGHKLLLAKGIVALAGKTA